MKKLNKDVQQSITQVHKLAAYRDEYLSIKQSSPRFERACKVLGISPETVRRHSADWSRNGTTANFIGRRFLKMFQHYFLIQKYLPTI